MLKIYNFPKTIIAATTIITLFFLFQLPNVIINNDLYIFLGEHNQARIDNDAVEAVYGDSDGMVVAIHSKYDDITLPENLRLIDSLTAGFEKLRHVEEVTSLTNADFIEATAEGMKVSALLPGELSSANTSKSEIIRRLHSWDAMYQKNLYTADLKSTQILLGIESDLPLDTLEVVYSDVMAVIDMFQRHDTEVYVAGVPAIAVILKQSMYSDLMRLIPIVILVVILTLYLSFRSLAGVILPLLTVLVSSVWTIGLMAFMNVPLTMVGIGIPVILISVGSAYGIHLISHTYDAMMHSASADFKTLVLTTVHKVGLPVLLAGLTTVAGFGSLTTSAIIPMRQSGLFLAFGVFVAIAVALLLIPSILILRKKPVKKHMVFTTGSKTTIIDRFLLAFYDLFTRHHIRNLLISLVIVILAIIGSSHILIDTNMIGNFRENTSIARADAFENKNFGGTTVMSIIVKGQKDGDLLNPDILKAMDDLVIYLEKDEPLVGKVISFTEFVKRMNQIMNIPAENSAAIQAAAPISHSENSGFTFEDESDTFADFNEESSFSFEESADGANEKITSMTTDLKFPTLTNENMITLLDEVILESGNNNLSALDLVKGLKRLTNQDGMAYYEIPYNPAKYPAATRDELKNLISQYLLLYSGSLDAFIDDPLEPSESRMIVQIKSPMNADIDSVDTKIMRYVKHRFPAGYEVKTTGSGKMAASVNSLVISSQTNSIISSLLIVFAIIAISFRSWIAGLYGIITLIFSLLINFGVMGFFGIKLDMGTSMVASVAIGIGIDYTIHFLSRYKLESKNSSDPKVITQNTLLSAGKAILFNAFSVAAGFAVLMQSNFIPIENLGLLIALTMVTSSLGALTLLPAMIHVFKPKFMNK